MEEVKEVEKIKKLKEIKEELNRQDNINASNNTNTNINSNSNIKYSIKINNFEGPLDLLVYLIDQNKINISDINISEIAGQYIDYLSEMQKLDLEIASSFLVMATDLMYLKSKRLLPQLEVDEELTEEELILQILEYKRYKIVQDKFRERYLKYSKRIEKRPDKIALKNLVFDRQYEKIELIKAYEFVLEKQDYLYNINSKTIDVISTQDTFTVLGKIKEIFKTLKTKNNFVFNKMFSLKEKSKNEVITAFISILELAKKNRIILKQEILYGDILVEKKIKEGETFKYE